MRSAGPGVTHVTYCHNIGRGAARPGGRTEHRPERSRTQDTAGRRAGDDAPTVPPDERDQARLLKELAQRLDHVVADVREAIDAAADEPVTQGLYIEVAQGLEKQRWMLRVHLARPAGDGPAA